MPQPIRTGTPWQNFPPTYRSQELCTLAQWIRAGASGAVLGPRGVGRSNLLGFLCHRPDVLGQLLDPTTLPVAFVPVDLGDLPTAELGDFYRVLLRAFYEVGHHFPDAVDDHIAGTYRAHRGESDAFLCQSALREVLYACQKEGLRVVMVVDRFDAFAPLLTPAMAQALGVLHDTFRDTLLYIVGIRQSLAYLTDLALDDDLYRLLTTHICYLGPLNEADARQQIQRRTAPATTPPTKQAIQTMLALTGGYPTLLKAVCRWWLLEADGLSTNHWRERLAEHPALRHRLQSIWSGLTQEEQSALTELVRDGAARPRVKKRGSNGAGSNGVRDNGGQSNKSASRPAQEHAATLHALVEKGICRYPRPGDRDSGWVLFGQLFADYVAEMGGMSRGRIWLNREADTLFHGQMPLTDLTPKEETLLRFLLQQPHTRHTYTDLIVHAWSDEENYAGVSNEALFQVIRGLRQKIEPQPASPVYVVNWRGKPEGGYTLYPEGRPG